MAKFGYHISSETHKETREMDEKKQEFWLIVVTVTIVVGFMFIAASIGYGRN